MLATLAFALLLLDPPTQQRFDVSLGYADLALVDRAATRLPYRSPSAHVRLRYAGERRHVRWWAAVQTNVGPLHAAGHGDRQINFSSIDPITGEVEEVDVPMRGRMLAPGVDLGVQAKWPLGTSAWSLFVGGAITWDVAYASGFATPGMMQMLAFQPTFGVRVEPKPEHRIELLAATTLGAWTTRMPYHQTVSLPDHGRLAGFFEQGSRWQGVGTLQTVRAALSYEYRITQRWSVEARYQLRWLHQALPRDLRSIEHLVAFGFSVHF